MKPRIIKFSIEALRSVKQHEGVVLPVALALILSACGGSGGTNHDGSEKPQNDTPDNDTPTDVLTGFPSQLVPDDALSFILSADNGSVSVDVSESETETGVTPVTEQMQLVAGSEVLLENPVLTTTEGSAQLRTRVVNTMSGYVIRSLTVVVDSGDTEEGSSGREFYFFDGDFQEFVDDDNFLLAGDGIDINLEVPLSETPENLRISIYADTAEHIIYTGSSDQSGARSNLADNRVVVNNFADFASEIETASPGAVIVIDLPQTNKVAELIIESPINFPNWITISGTQSDTANIKAGFAGSEHMFTTRAKVDFKWLEIYGADGAAAVHNLGELNLTAVRFSQNSGSRGGAILNEGNVIIHDGGVARGTQFIGNVAEYGGAIYNERGFLDLRGGTFFKHNNALLGGAIYVYHGRVEVSRTGPNPDEYIEFHTNFADRAGGAILNYDGVLELDRTGLRFIDNLAVNGQGGAIYNQGRSDIVFGYFSGNAANTGGAIHNEAQMSLEYTEFYNNRAAVAGGAVNTCGTTFIMRASLMALNTFSAVSDPNNPQPTENHQQPANGGAINITKSCPAAQTTRATTSDNRQVDYTYQDSSSTDRLNDSGEQVVLEHVTIWNNLGVEGQYGTGVYMEPGTSLRVHNSIIAMNPGGNAFVSDVDAEIPEAVNFVSTNSFYSVMDRLMPGSGDIVSENPFDPLDPMLGTGEEELPTLSPFSLAIGAGDCSGQVEDTLDLRGEKREGGGSCDMGAYELTEEELSATEIVSTRALMIEKFAPEDDINPSEVQITLAEPRLEVHGFVDPADLVDLKISINYGTYKSHPNLDRILRNEGTFVFRANTFLLEASALRAVANSRNIVHVRALYADGTVTEVYEDFLLHFSCRDLDGGHCSYTGGQIPEISVDYSGDFVWYEMGNVAPTAFTMTLSYRPLG